MNATALSERFGLNGTVTYRTITDGLVVADIDNALAKATICPQGAHIMTWQPKSQAAPVVWLSRMAKVAPGKSIRGGVPVCWPWFGAHVSEATFPAHGFARTTMWELQNARRLDDGATQLELILAPNDKTRAWWPHETPVSLSVTIGDRLQLALTTHNRDQQAVTIGEALHTYFHISDIADISVTGLDGADYHDKVGTGGRKRQTGSITFSGETDRVYVDTETECVIEDPGLRRGIHIAKTGSRATVVWTPWTEKADKMGDFGPDGWRGMVCVESANAMENLVSLAPGDTHTLAVTYWVEGME